MVQPSVESVNRLVNTLDRLANPGSSDYSHAAVSPARRRYLPAAGTKEQV
jgi:hypothetical protein